MPAFMDGWRNNDTYIRECARDIARDRIEYLPPEYREGVLSLVDALFFDWRASQAGEDGMVEVTVSPGVQGRGLLGDFSIEPRFERVPVDSVPAHRCAGQWVSCDFDLFSKLLNEKNPDAAKLDHLIGAPQIFAILVERDAASMPLDSIATAVRLIWLDVFLRAKAFGSALKESDKRSAEIAAKRQLSSKLATETKVRVAGMQHAQWKAIAHQAFLTRPSASYAWVSSEVRRALQSRGFTARNRDPSLRLPSESTIKDVLQAARVKDGALDELGRRKK
jgi:hypothetical protein